MYAQSEALKTGAVTTPRGAGYVLKQLCGAGVIRWVGEMPMRAAYGTRLYVPPDWWPTDLEARAVVVETGWHDRAADLVWVPDQPNVVGRAVEPGGEGGSQPLVVDDVGTLHVPIVPPGSAGIGGAS
jgi:hypothetical protein